MPCINLLSKTGNPYPSERTPAVVTDYVYFEFVNISHFIWNEIKQLREIYLYSRDAGAILEVAAKSLGVSKEKAIMFGKGPNEALYCVIDTLRDLALWGLVGYERKGLYVRRFRLKA
ncbi:MAG: hypothetical protein WAS21_19485 [Geminicoccaceae bacterium]